MTVSPSGSIGRVYEVTRWGSIQWLRCSGFAVVEEINFQPGEVDFDPLDKHRCLLVLEVVVYEESRFAGLKVDFDQIDRTGLSEQL